MIASGESWFVAVGAGEARHKGGKSVGSGLYLQNSENGELILITSMKVLSLNFEGPSKEFPLRLVFSKYNCAFFSHYCTLEPVRVIFW